MCYGVYGKTTVGNPSYWTTADISVGNPAI